MGKRGSITYQIQKRLQDKMAPGADKHRDKTSGKFGKGKTDPDKIYSYQTLEDYMRISNRFAKWAQAKYGKAREIDDLQQYAAEWLTDRAQRLQPSTVKQDRAALAKLYGCAADELVKDLPLRERKGFVKNRGDKWQGHYSKEAHPQISLLSEGAGLRRHEMPRVDPKQVTRHEDDGRAWIDDVRGKGGKIRSIPIRRGYEDKILAWAEEAKAAGRDRLLTEKIPARAPIHADRGQEYAQALYNEFARPLDQLSRSEIYYGRKDLKGCRWDKAALKKVTEALGHNRLNVVANYLR